MAISEEREYLFGTGDDELARLGLQHALWSEVAARGWEHAGFRQRQALLDVGCGPGYTTFDLARLVGPHGRVHGVDISERFVAHLRGQARIRGASNVTAEVTEIAHLSVDAEFDGAFARWVLCYVSDLDAAIHAVARALKPGGAFAVHDYSRYEGVVVAPEHPVFERVFAAVVASWRASGGNPHVGAELPAAMERAGLEVVRVEPIVRTARPSDALWRWPRTFFDNYLPTLVSGGYLDWDDMEEFDARWAEWEHRPGVFFQTPPMVEVVGVRRR